MDRSTSKSSDRARHDEIVKRVRGEEGSPTAKVGSSLLLVRLAHRLGLAVDDLAIRLSSDTVRRTKYPVHEHKNADGSITYTAPTQIHEGPMSR